MAVDTRSQKVEFTRRLANGGYDDFLVLERDTADSVLTEKRLELLDTLRAASVESISELATRVDRDVSAVHRDLDVLFEHGLLEYETTGSRKEPRLKHEHVFVEPIF